MEMDIDQAGQDKLVRPIDDLAVRGLGGKAPVGNGQVAL